jgi:hypothetical protein
MNRLQITILWIVLTAALPAAYFVISRGLSVEKKLSENQSIREMEGDGGSKKQVFLITVEDNGKLLTYEVEMDHYPKNDAEILRLLPSSRLLSDREAKAWDYKDVVERERRTFWELSALGFFTVISVTGLLLYRAMKSYTPSVS